MSEWIVSRCEYDIDPAANGQVKVTNMHWRTSLVEGGFAASAYGSTPDDQNRVHALPALEAVPMNVLVKWAQAALGEKEVARIEAGLTADIAAQKTPTSGGFTPS